MLLTKAEKQALIAAREKIESGSESFICIALAEVSSWIDMENLTGAIQESILGYGTVEDYLVSHVGIVSDEIVPGKEKTISGRTKTRVSYSTFEQYALMARLAWIDRMLETGKIE